MAKTNLSTLVDAHEKQSAAITTKQLDCEKWRVNPNDIGWLYLWPQVDRQLGRSKRVYHRLTDLSGL